MDRIELTPTERESIAVMKGNIVQAETLLTSWKFGFQATLNAILNRAVSGIDASYTLNPEGTALVRDLTPQPPVQVNGAPMTNGTPLPPMDAGAN